MPDRLAHRLKFLRPVPMSIGTTFGDILSNLRAALESLAFEVARRTQGGQLTSAQQQFRFPTARSCSTCKAGMRAS